MSAKIITPLINEIRVSDSYFCTHVSYLLNFDTDGVVSFDTNYYLLPTR